ncbi:MAG: methionine synthase [Actinomycetales bacterium]|nr:methionine synthase [Actinomycetales bacterium]
MIRASGIGSWPGVDVRETLTVLRELLGDHDNADGVSGVPYLPELPGRGPGSDLIGRSAGLLVGLPVDLQPMGWRFVDRPGRDAARTGALWSEDLDELAEAFDGYTGPLRLTVAGPWTLTAGIWLHRGERVIVDEGARRDVAESLAEGIRDLLATVQRLVPGAVLALQVDEPSLPAVLEGRLPTASGFGMMRAIDPQEALGALRTVLAAAGERHTVIHCCAAHPPLPLLRRTGATGLSVDTTLLSPRGWEGLAVAAEEGIAVYAGCVPTDPAAAWAPREIAEEVATAWHRVGLVPASLASLVITPACGLADVMGPEAVRRQRGCLEVAAELAERAGS